MCQRNRSFLTIWWLSFDLTILSNSITTNLNHLKLSTCSCSTVNKGEFSCWSDCFEQVQIFNLNAHIYSIIWIFVTNIIVVWQDHLKYVVLSISLPIFLLRLSTGRKTLCQCLLGIMEKLLHLPQRSKIFQPPCVCLRMRQSVEQNSLRYVIKFINCHQFF